MFNLLIVDDDIPTAEVIHTSIKWNSIGIDEVYIAYDAENAKKLFAAHKIDIVISDIEMPQETGLDLLKWIRKEEIDCEVLLLTCHENFDYATYAISYEAAAYLTKPFNAEAMELNLQKIIAKLKTKISLKKASNLGVWMEKNQHHMKAEFWRIILEDSLLDNSMIQKEITDRHLDIDVTKKFCLIYTKLSNNEADMERYGKSVYEFIMEGFHSEILTDKIENEDVVKLHIEDALCFVTIREAGEKNEMEACCERLNETCKGYFVSTISCCISAPYAITELAAVKDKLNSLLDVNVNNYGKIFHESDVEFPRESAKQVLDLERILKGMERKDKAEILYYLKQVISELTICKKLNKHTLYILKQEIIQVVYAELLKHGIQATKLFYDELSRRMTDKAMDSTVDMIRWINYLLEKTFEYEEEVVKAVTLVDKINEYIAGHFSEDISRNEIAGQVYLTPEYMAKLYKKKTGKNLKDMINEYRIEKAKEYLKVGEKNISDIAEAVGFDNFSYFSTVFKKIVGVSPKEFKNI